ncbi:MAG: Spy/CpxP family protein refolding chaperone [Duncaniella sp.]|nr:Spy/CpxP family protein refolding chaperone [Duncaniella sp.]
MKKTILSLAILLISSTGLSAFAQSADKNTKPQDKNRTEMRARKGGEPRDILKPFEGLNLTDQQKSKLQDLKKAEMEQKKQLREQNKQLKEKKRAEAKAKKEAGKQARAKERRDYLAKIKSILTPEQYVQFLENNFVNKVDKQGPRKGAKDRKFAKGDRKNSKHGKFAKNDRNGSKDGKVAKNGRNGSKDGKAATPATTDKVS